MTNCKPPWGFQLAVVLRQARVGKSEQALKDRIGAAEELWIVDDFREAFVSFGE